eukprot:495979-Hanusia_phi.AAC.3
MRTRVVSRAQQTELAGEVASKEGSKEGAPAMAKNTSALGLAILLLSTAAIVSLGVAETTFLYIITFTRYILVEVQRKPKSRNGGLFRSAQHLVPPPPPPPPPPPLQLHILSVLSDPAVMSICPLGSNNTACTASSCPSRLDKNEPSSVE